MITYNLLIATLGVPIRIKSKQEPNCLFLCNLKIQSQPGRIALNYEIDFLVTDNEDKAFSSKMGVPQSAKKESQSIQGNDMTHLCSDIFQRHGESGL